MPYAGALKVLIVDDQNSVRQMTRLSLEEFGVRNVYDSGDGASALKFAGSQPLDLIISDYNMPEMDGLALLRAVRAHPVVRRLPFILLTGRGDKEFTAAALREKIEQVVGKLQ